jgi:antitoxin ParD1/3/4
MHVALPPDLEQLVTARVQSGRYSSVSEVMREALLLLAEREQRSEVRRQELCHIYRPETRPLEIVCIVHSA